jgi:chaperonin GroES
VLQIWERSAQRRRTGWPEHVVFSTKAFKRAIGYRVRVLTQEDTEHMAINVKPLGDRVLVQPLEEKEVKKGGFIIPDTAKEKPQEGTVVAVGTGKLDDNGKKIEFNVKVGDKVLIFKYGATEIKIDGENYLILREDDILGIIG